jgi:hypothetical protein
VQDGSSPAKDLNGYNQNDFTRQQLAGDLRLTPNAVIDLSGRTVFDLADHLDTAPGTTVNTSRIAEHDYSLGLKFTPSFSLNTTFVQRNFRAYYAGTSLPSLFNPNEPGTFRAQGLSATVAIFSVWEAVIDLKKTHRESYGRATRFGGELRRQATESGFQFGFSFHRVLADDAPLGGVFTTSYGLSYGETRAWVMYEKDRLTATLDGIHHLFDDTRNPNLNGRSSVYELLGSVGYQTTPNLRVSGDFTYGITPLLKQQTMALLRADYRFGLASKGGSK